MATSRLIAALTIGFLAVGVAACGTSGSNPLEFSEVRFEIRPSGATTFRVQSLMAGGVNHPSVAGQEFTVSSTFNFVIENGAPPYAATFVQTGGGQIRVRLSITGQADIIRFSSGMGSSVTVMSGVPSGTPTPAGTPAPVPTPNPEIRFDVCAPVLSTLPCSVLDGSSVFGVGFTGTIGDAFTTHLLTAPCPSATDSPCDATPGVYFLEGAFDSVNGVFHTVAPSQPLLVELLINGVVQQTGSGTGEVVIRQDL